MSEADNEIAEVAPTAPWLEPWAFAASLVAITVSTLVCYALLAAAFDWASPNLSEPSGTVIIAASFVAWLGCAIAGIVFGAIALVRPYRHRRRSAIAMVLSVASLLLVPIVGLGAFVAWAGPHHPSDDTLIENFTKHESEFTQVIADFKASGRVNNDQLRKLGVEGHSRGTGGALFMPVSTWGIVPSGSSKGYVYSTQPLDPVVDGDLDDHGLGDGYTYRHITGPWYLYYEFW